MTDQKQSYTDKTVEYIKQKCTPDSKLEDVITALREFAVAEYEKKAAFNEANKGCLTWGKYRNKKLVDVAILDPKYIDWIRKNTEYLNADLKEILAGL